MTDEVLLALLNSSPVIDGVPADELADVRSWRGLDLSVTDRETLRAGRDLLQAVVRGARPPSALAGLLDGVVSRPGFTGDELTWTLEPLPPARALLVEAVLTLAEIRTTRPGRLRPCGNDECALFLLDRSKSNSARWCSMAVCGNRLKARRHHERTRQG